MSVQFTLAKATEIAERVVAELRPFCKRIEIAGSLRRKKAMVKDIELVMILNDDRILEFSAAINQWPMVKGKATGKYAARTLPEGINVDMFIAKPDNFGAIMLIRTGDWEFSKKYMGTVITRRGYRMDGGFLWKRGEKVPVREEIDMFSLVGLQYIEPYRRSANVI